MICGIADGGSGNAAYWVDYWQREGQKYLDEHQRQETEHLRSSWQQANSDNPNRRLADYLGNAPAYKSSLIWGNE